MTDNLQALLERISEEGFKKVDSECKELLADAKTKSDAMLEDAKTEAAEIRAHAKQDADLFREKGEQALRQAARDVLLSLRTHLEERVSTVARTLVAETCDPEALANILSTVVQNFLDSHGQEERLEVLLNEKELAAVETALRTRMGKELSTNCELSPTPEVSAGFRLRISGEDVFYDFSDAALGDAMAAFLSPKLAALLTPRADSD